jgi:ketosteroid isomerase-like protein
MDTRAEIERPTAKFAKVVTDKDFAAIGPFYEERARFLPPGAPMVEGPAAIQAIIQKMVGKTGQVYRCVAPAERWRAQDRSGHV